MEEKKIKSDSVKKNFIFQILYQFVIFALPLIVSPYLTRILGDTNLGIYTYTYSIAYYFVVFAMLGISRHGQRIIAARRNDYVSLRKTFWSLYFFHSVLSILSLAAFLIFCGFQNEIKTIYFIQGVYVLSALFDITWLFYGLETFKSVVIKNFIIKILETISIFIFVKTENDLVIYTWIKVISVCVGQAVMLPQAIKLIKPIKFSFLDVKEHIVPMLFLSIAVIASTLYTVFDKTLLGLMSNKENVAYYDYSDKIISIPKAIVAVVGTVLFPRACACFANFDIDGMRKYFKYAVLFTYFIGFASIFGLIAVADLFSLLYYGDKFVKCGSIIKAMSPVILIVCIGDIVRTQFLIPMKKDLLFTISLVMNAVLNIALSILLITYLDIYGVVIGSLAAETLGTIFQIIICRKYVDFNVLFLYLFPFIFAGSMMFASVELIKIFFNTSILDLLFQFLVGASVYCTILFIFFIFIDSNKFEYRNLLKTLFSKKK